MQWKTLSPSYLQNINAQCFMTAVGIFIWHIFPSVLETKQVIKPVFDFISLFKKDGGEQYTNKESNNIYKKLKKSFFTFSHQTSAQNDASEFLLFLMHHFVFDDTTVLSIKKSRQCESCKQFEIDEDQVKHINQNITMISLISISRKLDDVPSLIEAELRQNSNDVLHICGQVAGSTTVLEEDKTLHFGTFYILVLNAIATGNAYRVNDEKNVRKRRRM